MNSFQQLEQEWGTFLCDTGDISSKGNISFLRQLQQILHSGEEAIPEDRFYLQEQAGFLRFRILEILDGNGTEYQVNFHQFGPSQTHVHIHGYMAHSFVLDGELYYKNFIPKKIGFDTSNQLKEKFKYLKLFWGDDYDEKLEMIGKEFHENLLGVKTNFSQASHFFSAFIGWGCEDAKIASPNDMYNLVRDKDDTFYELSEVGENTVLKGGEYSVEDFQGHSVGITDAATTLFITKKQVSKCIGGEYFLFPENFSKDMKLRQQNQSKIKQDILTYLKKIDI